MGLWLLSTPPVWRFVLLLLPCHGCPPSSGGGCVHMAAAGAQFNYAVFVRGRDLSYLWCVCVSCTHTHPRHHQLSPTPNTHMHMSSRACIPKVICICV